jgi:hypothetical protein
MANHQIAELMRLHQEGLVGNQLTQPHPSVMCSLNGSKVAALNTNCGSPFGPELMMGHVLAKTLGSPTSLIKVAEGGTTLERHWRSPSRGEPVGDQYNLLSARIKSLASKPAEIHPDCASKKCRWAAFIYFQGENDAFDSDAAKAYESSLRALIKDVRSDIGNPNLPVIILRASV